MLQRDEADGPFTGAPRQINYLFDGVQLGGISNDGTDDVDYVASIARHRTLAGAGPFRNGATFATAIADFDQSYTPINGFDSGRIAGRYTVQDGDTLASIAQAVWGDASLWYMIADANGMASGQGLAAGMTLAIPDKVVNLHNGAGTFKVYDPNRAQGESGESPETRCIHRFIHRIESEIRRRQTENKKRILASFPLLRHRIP